MRNKMYMCINAHSWRKHTRTFSYILKEVSKRWQEIEQFFLEKQNKSSRSIQSYVLRNGHFMQLNRCQTIPPQKFPKIVLHSLICIQRYNSSLRSPKKLLTGCVYKSYLFRLFNNFVQSVLLLINFSCLQFTFFAQSIDGAKACTLNLGRPIWVGQFRTTHECISVSVLIINSIIQPIQRSLYLNVKTSSSTNKILTFPFFHEKI